MAIQFHTCEFQKPETHMKRPTSGFHHFRDRGILDHLDPSPPANLRIRDRYLIAVCHMPILFFSFSINTSLLTTFTFPSSSFLTSSNSLKYTTTYTRLQLEQVDLPRTADLDPSDLTRTSTFSLGRLVLEGGRLGLEIHHSSTLHLSGTCG